MSTQANFTTEPVAVKGNIFRKTNRHKGRKVVITPENSTMKHLRYARTVLDRQTPEARFETGSNEAALICLSGEVTVEAAGQEFTLDRYDTAYIPRDSTVKLSTKSSSDIAEFSAAVKEKYPLQIIRYADVTKDKSLHFTTGGPSTTRNLNILVGKNVQAGRVVAGFTISEPGHWTSWPPHEHAALLEEMYVYIEMPAPGFGLQFVYTDTEEPELATVVREGDAVLMPRGFHPNVAAPGHRIGFLWAMAAHKEKEGRQFGVVNVQPGFDQSGSGLEASRK